jgi:hypothetical protein
MERSNTESYLAPTEAPLQSGLAERGGGILKTMHRAIVHEVSVEDPMRWRSLCWSRVLP